MNIPVQNKNLNKAIDVLKRKLRKDGIFSALKDREEGVNARGRKRIKKSRAEKRRKKKSKNRTKTYVYER